MSVQSTGRVSLVPAAVVETRVFAGSGQPPRIRRGLVDAVEAAGLEGAESLDFRVTDGLLVATGLDERVDGRSSETARTLHREEGKRTRAISLPAKPLREWEEAPANIREESTRLLLYAGEGTLAFQDVEAARITLRVDNE